MRRVLLLACCLGLGACASIIDGTSQRISLNTNPPGADCAIERDGGKIAEVAITPGSVLIEKSKRDITISCTRAGFSTATYLNKSGLNADIAGNFLAGGGIGLIVDSATGADNHYEGAVNITMVPLSALAAVPAAAASGVALSSAPAPSLAPSSAPGPASPAGT